ncbi:MAG TPA: NUDIX hydrolase [Rhodocyclaceae bacterium]|jgi:ADP-ribose pyrophosphatase YjhB (NUDIX family)
MTSGTVPLPTDTPAYCRHCGQRTVYRVPPGDSLPRQCCDHCGAIHYDNPKLVLGTLPVWADKVLLCRRAIEPRYGLWTLPAGFMENNETTAEAAARETDEEAGAQIELLDLYTMISVPHISQIHGFYRARLLSPEFKPGEETLEARLFGESEIPWDELAFRTVKQTLQHYFADRKNGHYPFRSFDIIGPPPK